MSTNIMRKANALICVIIIAGFTLTSWISYHSNREVFEKEAERVSTLTLEGISGDIDELFDRPIGVSLAMANDSLLKALLKQETHPANEEAFVETIREYLDAYRMKYGYDSVFLVSTQTQRYYHFNGIDRIMEPDDPEDVWYFTFVEEKPEHAINVDNDEAAADEITVFVNCRIDDEAGNVLGVIGVGLGLDDLQAILASYDAKTGTKSYLVNPEGTIEASSVDRLGYQQRNLFDLEEFAHLEPATVTGTSESSSWYRSHDQNGYVMTRPISQLGWTLVVDNNTSNLELQATRQFALSIAIIVAVIALVLLSTTSISRRLNAHTTQQIQALEREHKTIFQEAAETLYENIYEINITHNKAASEATEAYFASLGAPRNVPYDQALSIIAERQIAPEFRQGYLDAFCTQAVLDAHQKGEENLTYEFKTTDDGVSYHWVRIYAHLFVWDEDKSLRMLVYRQNIDNEKRRERHLFEQMQRDSLTGLYNKAATQRHISELLAAAPATSFAFFILDIDDFKKVNDHFGHRAGDKVLTEFANVVRAQFRPYDVVGRIGGDEFVAFAPMPNALAAKKKADELVEALRLSVDIDVELCSLSSSVGVLFVTGDALDFDELYRLADQALYCAKAKGKSCYALDER